MKHVTANGAVIPYITQRADILLTPARLKKEKKNRKEKEKRKRREGDRRERERERKRRKRESAGGDRVQKLFDFIIEGNFYLYK
jgi:hypothetical protein